MLPERLGLSEKQIADRRRGIGASEVAAVVGVVPGAIDVWARKVGEFQDDSGPNDLLEFGHRIEEVIGDAYQARHPETRIYTPGTVWHPTVDFACASPDRVVAAPGLGRPAREAWLRLLEIKTVFFSSAEYGERADEIPERHLVQVAWQQECCDVEDATLVALVNGRYREYEVKRDREFGALLLDAVARFWHEHVLARIPPPVDGSIAYSDYLRRRHPRDQGPLLPASDEARELVARLREAKKALKDAETREAEAGNMLRALIGDAAGIESLCTWRNNKPTEKVDLEAAVEGLIIRLCENPLSGGYSLPRPKVEALWEEVRRDFATTKPGARVLRLAKE